MKKLYLIGIASMVLAGLFTSCNNRIEPDGPDTPVNPEESITDYRLIFDGGVDTGNETRAHWSDPRGSGNLTFQWDYTPAGEDGDEMVMALHKEEFVESIEGDYYTYATIKPHTQDPDVAYKASFETVQYYDSPLSSGDYDGYRVIALTPLTATNNSEVFSDESEFYATLPMPNTFEQDAHKEPAFLRDYMYMYDYGYIDGGSASFFFQHIPATFRFKIVNNRLETARINSVKVTVVDADGNEHSVASQSVGFKVIASNNPKLTYSEETYTEVTTNINTDLATGELFTAYALVLPLDGNAPLQGKKIRFSIDASNPDNEHLSFELDAETLANANRGIYNWKAGKSYTINMKLDDVLTLDGITVTGWEEVFGGGLETE